eukprot:CAMPEP_0177223230 /NCGR_PEP_ID=MMETSP0367-20130122/38361_1 /TAXON_ID=447022 ORGANISM="Scrippsiella hangoei-like, Strain SHHI-4" /NCGR_SAMPLE_ID=MMETSP0367 /ASSEMBLY_ACC=CAM_ASM_000362 /LENGTH=97 /DNA_ID=CAMNT_0018673161 /DNA_START=24 /DNA_END=317 /DNA_ORIENTATION=+
MNAPPPPAGLDLGRGFDPANLMSAYASIENLKNRHQITLLRDYVSDVVPEVMKVMVQRVRQRPHRGRRRNGAHGWHRGGVAAAGRRGVLALRQLAQV